MRRRSPMRRASASRRDRARVSAFSDDVRIACLARAGWSCEARVTEECRRSGGDLERIGWSLQHRRARMMGGSRDADLATPVNGLVLCGSGTTGCHGWVERHRTEAQSKGWSVPSWGDPAAFAVTLWDGRIVRLEPEATYEVIFKADGSAA